MSDPAVFGASKCVRLNREVHEGENENKQNAKYTGQTASGPNHYHPVVIPAEAGIHLDLRLSIQKQNGFPLPRE
jgi:hypothetical protein